MNDKELIKGGIEIKPYFQNDMLIAQIKNTTDEDIEAFRKSLGITDSWHIETEIKENPAERKRQLMRLEKEMLVDMVFNLESRNETLVNNLLEVEKICAKLKEEVENG